MIMMIKLMQMELHIVTINDFCQSQHQTHELTSDYSRKGLAMASDVSPIEGRDCGIAFQPSQAGILAVQFQEHYLESGNPLFLIF